MIKKYLFGHTNEKNAYLVNNYPWGYHYKTQRRFWIETVAGKGDRFVYQTKNPKTGLWCKPKKSTYSAVMVLGLNEKGHASYDCFNTGWDKEERINEFLKAIGGLEKLNNRQAYKVKEALAISKTQDLVTVEIDKKPNRTPEEQAKHDQEQAEVQKTLGKAFNYYMAS